MSLGYPQFKRGTGLHKRTDPKRIAAARKMKIAGYTYAQIGKKFGVSASMAANYLRISADRRGRCENCGYSGPNPLHCHHVDYSSDNNFKMLCASCHAKEHPEVIKSALEAISEIRAVREAGLK